MKSPENFDNSQNLYRGEISENISRFGIGHMPEGTQFSLDKIKETDRTEVLKTYKSCVADIESLLDTLERLVAEVNVENRGTEVFDDLLNGISEALHKTANQIMYNAEIDPEESLAAFDELAMILESVNQSIIAPRVLSKKQYPNSAIYELEPLETTEGFKMKSFDALFSKDHIAFNLNSTPLYQDVEKEIKSGVRLDYGPLYKETSEGIDKTKTGWTSSVDISGFYIDRIMNRYSPRGHHFTKIFDYKMNLLLSGLAKQMEYHFDSVKEYNE